MAWPLHDLVLTTPDLTLRAMNEQDAVALEELIPDDVERHPGRAALGHDVQQMYARHLGGWSVEDWTLPFVVLHEDARIGVQGLEGKDFLRLRVVDSWSWLVP